MTPEQMFFSLHGDTIFRRNDKDGSGALYLLPEAKVLTLEPSAVAVLDALWRGLSPDAAAEATGRKPDDVRSFVAMLEISGAGCCLSAPCYVEPLRACDPLASLPHFRAGSELQRLHVFPTPRCTMSCSHCTRRENATLKPCMGCSRPSRKRVAEVDLGASLLTRGMREAAELGCESLTFHVGDCGPIAELVVRSLKAASELGFGSVELITGTGLVDSVLRAAVGAHALITFQLLGANSATHDAACRRRGTFDAIIRSARLLLKGNASIGFYCLRSGVVDWDKSEAWLELVRDLRPRRVVLDRIVTRRSLRNTAISGYIAEESFSPPDALSYLKSLQQTCVSGQLFVGSDGYVYTCPYLIREPIGSLERPGIYGILADGREDPFWRKPISHPAECRGCRWNPACNLCPVAKALLSGANCAVANQMPPRIQERISNNAGGV